MGGYAGFGPDTIHHGDALELLPCVPDGSVDLIVTDPPFAIDFSGLKGNYNRTRERVIPGYCEVESDDYLHFSETWMREAYRALTDSGSMYVFSGWNRLKEILIALDRSRFVTKNHIIWKYQFGVFTKRKFVTSHYHLLFVVKDPRNYTFNKIDHYPEDVWRINREYWKGTVKTPTKLPLALVKKIIRYSSNEGDVVLDPFLGSGTVAVGAAVLNRHFIGFEIVGDFHSLACKRLRAIGALKPCEQNTGTGV